MIAKSHRKIFPSTPRTLFAAIALAFAVAGCGGDSPDAMLVSAKDYLAKNDTAAATIQLKNALAKKPDFAEARYLLGSALLKSGDPTAAEVELQKALDYGYAKEKVTPVLARVLLSQGQAKKVIEQYEKASVGGGEPGADLKTSLAQAYAGLGQFDKARSLFTAAVADDATYAAAHLGLARLQAFEKDFNGALATVEGVLSKATGNAEAWHFKAALLRALGKPDQAMEANLQAVSHNPKLLSAHAAIIMAHLQGQKPDLAATQLAAMEKASAKHPLTYYMQAQLALNKKDLTAARTAADALIKVQPNSPEALQLQGIIAFENRSDVQAQEFLSKALKVAPGLDPARRMLIASYLRSTQPVKALTALKPVLHDSETDPSWFALAGQVYLQNGEVQKAEDYFARAAKVDPKNARNRTALALTRMQMGRTEQAFADLEQIAASDEGTSADMALVSTAMRQRQFDKALKAVAQLEKKQPNNAGVINLRGNVYAAKGDLKSAREQFERALGIDASFFPAAASLARIDMQENRKDDARKRFEGVLAKDPKSVAALMAIADLRSRDGAGVDEVAALLTKAIAAAPDDAAPRLSLVKLYLQAKDNNKAVGVIQEALTAMPEKPEVIDLAGYVMQLAGNTNQALAHYGKLASMFPDAPQPHLKMAELHLASKNTEAARNSINLGLAAKPDSVPLQRAMIMLDMGAGKFTEALARARDVQKGHAREIIGYQFEGDIHATRKAWDEAINAYRAGLKVNDKSTDLAMRLAAAFNAAGKEGDAKRFAETWVKSNPKDYAFRGFLADMANRKQDYAGAASIYRAMVGEQPRNPALLNNLAWTLGKLGDPKALSYAEEANKLAPNQAQLLDTLGVLLVDSGKTDEGLAALRKAAELAPQLPEVKLNLAKALIKANKKPEARQELEALVKLGDTFPAQAEVTKLLQGL